MMAIIGLACKLLLSLSIVISKKRKNPFNYIDVIMNIIILYIQFQCLAVDPSLIEAYSRRSECYFQLCDFQSSLLNLKKCCLLNPEENYSDRLAFIYYFYGQCLFDQRMFVEALDCFSRAAEIKPNVQVYNTRTIACLSALGRHGECLALVNKHLEQDRENPDLFVMRARFDTPFAYYYIS